MKRFAPLLAVIAACVGQAAAIAAPPLTVSVGEVSRTSIEFHFHQGPYLVFVGMEGPGNRLALTVIRHGASADYSTKPRFHGDSIKASFGRLGSLDLTFTPTPGKVHRCESIVDAEGVFTGDFEFTGEHSYIHLDIHRVEGEYTTAGSCFSERPASPARSRPATGAGEERGVTLLARTLGPWPLETFSAIAERGPEGFEEGGVAGFRWERYEGMQVIRGAQIGIGADRLHWDVDAGTATVHPSAPFTGSATFTRRPGGKPRWTGSLQVPILGGRPLSLTGSRFEAHLKAGSPFE